MFLHREGILMAVSDRKAKSESPVYSGSKTKTGNSDALRFEKSLFRSHPEFSGQVKAKVIAPGYLLVMADPTDAAAEDEDDPIIGAFLAVLENDMPSHIQKMDSDLFDRLDDLVGHIDVDLDEDLGDESLL
jgi:antitoxin PrlF